MTTIREATEDGSVIEFPSSFGGYSYIRTIGCGSSSIVILATEVATQTAYACKVVSLLTPDSESVLAKFRSEIEMLKSLKHENIVEMHDAIYTEEHLFLLLEYCPNGDLLNYVINNERLPYDQIQRFFYQIVSAVCFMHDCGIAHRDIKPENILLDSRNRVKIGDFGFSRQGAGNVLMQTPCGSPFYAAPEIISTSEYDGTKSDVWSVGVVLFGLATQSLPWTAQNQAFLTYQITNAQFTIPEFVEPEVSEAIMACLQVDPNQRASAADLLQTKILRDITPEARVALGDGRGQGRKSGVRRSSVFAQKPVVRAIVKPMVARSVVYRSAHVSRTPPPGACPSVI
jgi:serine/threonine protein kinase